MGRRPRRPQHAVSAVNEPVLSYAPGTPERAALRAALAELAGRRTEMPLRIGGREVRTKRTFDA
ncbi:MAG: hypothetical protein FJ034_08630, partial [Chloroflexi bacterium]|nr:hypothetical protein [Chloroflexota bacterium]